MGTWFPPSVRRWICVGTGSPGRNTNHATSNRSWRLTAGARLRQGSTSIPARPVTAKETAGARVPADAWLWAPDSASSWARRSGRSGQRPASCLRGDGRFRPRTCRPDGLRMGDRVPGSCQPGLGFWQRGFASAMQNTQSLGDIPVEVAKAPMYLPDFSSREGCALHGIVRSRLTRRLARHAHR